MSDGRASSILAELGDGSLISIVPGLSDVILEQGTVRLFAPKTEVISQGKSMDHLIFPLDGGLTLLHQPTQGAPREIGYLKKRQTLALGELIREIPINYSAVTEAATRVLFITKAEFFQLLRREPDTHHYLKLITTSSGVRGFKNFLAERGVKHADIVRLLRAIGENPEAFEAGQEVAGSAPSLIFVRSGMLKVEEKTESQTSWSVSLGEGAWFGGEALVEPYQVSYKATVLQRVEVHFAPLDRIREQLRSLGLVEEVYNDPWIARNQASMSTGIELPPSEMAGIKTPANERGLRKYSTVWAESTLSARTDTESFLATLSNICRLLGVQINLSIVETAFALDRRLSFLRLAEILETFGLHTHFLRPSFKTLDRQTFPGLAMFGPRLVILLRANAAKKCVYVHDPARGIVTLTYKELDGLWDGAMLSVTKLSFGNEQATGVSSAAAEKARGGRIADIKNKISTSALLGYVWRFRRILLNVLLLDLMATGVHLTTPLFSQHILDEVLALRDTDTLWTCVIGLLLAMVISTLIKTGADYSLSEFSMRFDQALSTYFYRHALSLPGESYSKQKTGDILSRINSITHIRRLLSSSAIEAIVMGLSVGVYFIVLSSYSITIALLATAILAMVGFGQVFMRRTLMTNYRTFFENDAKARSLLTEQITSIATIKATGSELEMRSRWEGVQLDVIRTQKSNRRVGLALGVGLNLLTGITQLLAIWISARLAIDKLLSPGQVLAVSMYVGQMIAPVATLSGLVMNSAMFEVAIQRLEELMSMRTEQDDASNIKVRHSFPFRGKVRLDGVGFRYNKDSPWVLKDISLTVYPKQVVAIVGRSGCGKSTLANLIAANLRPAAGRIFFDDFDGQFLSVGSLRSQIGFVMQHNELFSGSIAENVAYGFDYIDRDAVDRSTRQAGADFLQNMPGGMDYYLGTSGVGLSGGEKQRISVARTFYRNTKILILDEATSALDSITEKTLNNNLREIVRDKTVIIIAHRLSTIRSADRILVMDEGRIVEEGTHSDLLEKNGFYSKLFQSQMKLAEA